MSDVAGWWLEPRLKCRSQAGERRGPAFVALIVRRCRRDSGINPRRGSAHIHGHDVSVRSVLLPAKLVSTPA